MHSIEFFCCSKCDWFYFHLLKVPCTLSRPGNGSFLCVFTLLNPQFIKNCQYRHSGFGLCPNNGPGFRPLLVTAHPLRSLALSALCSFLFPIWFLLQRFFTRFLTLLAPFCLDRTAQCLQSFRPTVGTILILNIY